MKVGQLQSASCLGAANLLGGNMGHITFPPGSQVKLRYFPPTTSYTMSPAWYIQGYLAHP